MVGKLISKRVVLRPAPNLVIHTTHPPAFRQENPPTGTDQVPQRFSSDPRSGRLCQFVTGLHCAIARLGADLSKHLPKRADVPSMTRLTPAEPIYFEPASYDLTMRVMSGLNGLSRVVSLTFT
jgi:hypothetical protein